MIWRDKRKYNTHKSVEITEIHSHTVWKNQKFTAMQNIFRQINLQ